LRKYRYRLTFLVLKNKREEENREMARTRRPLARGTTFWSGTNAGVSVGTTPSGVTFDQYGFTTNSAQIDQTELDMLDGIAAYPVGNATAGKLVVSGASKWAGTTVSLVTGLTTVDQLMVTLISESSATHLLHIVTGLPDAVPGYVSAAIRYNPNGAGSSIATSAAVAPGCTIAFIAMGS